MFAGTNRHFLFGFDLIPVIFRNARTNPPQRNSWEHYEKYQSAKSKNNAHWDEAVRHVGHRRIAIKLVGENYKDKNECREGRCKLIRSYRNDSAGRVWRAIKNSTTTVDRPSYRAVSSLSPLVPRAAASQEERRTQRERSSLGAFGLAPGLRKKGGVRVHVLTVT